MSRRTEERPELRLENARLSQAEPDTTQAGMSAALWLREPAGVQCRIHQRTCELLFVDVESPNRHRTSVHSLDELAIDVVLLVLGSHVRWSADEHEFGSIQADALCARAQRARHVVG